MTIGAVPFRPRFALSVLVGVIAGELSYHVALQGKWVRDFALVWYGARTVLQGHDPYAVIGPGRELEWVAGLFYPLPGVIAGIPFAAIPTAPLASGIFMALAAGTFAWALMEQGIAPILGLLSYGMLFSIAVVQWTPLYAGAYALAPLSIWFVVKPHTGFAFWIARPNWWAPASVILCTVAAFLIDPHWVASWRESLATGATLGIKSTGWPYTAPVLLPGGVLVLLAATRWRRPEARLLVALACVPQSLLFYEVVPLALIPRGWKQAGGLVLLSFVVKTLLDDLRPNPPTTMHDVAILTGRLYTVLMFLPCTAMVLRRPNEGRLPTWIEQRIATWPSWIRGTAGV